jgi:hypothetical protein
MWQATQGGEVMTLSDLAAAMWDRRLVTLTDAYGREIRDVIPTGLRRCTVDRDKWILESDRPGYIGQHVCVMCFDSFDSHTEPTP